MAGPHELKTKINGHNTYRDEGKLDIDIEGMAVKRLPPVVSMNYIKLTPAFYERPATDRQVFLWSLCSSMNNALDIMQRERNHVLEELLPRKEALVAQLQNQNAELSLAMSNATQRMNDEANARATELHETKKAHREEIKDLQGRYDDLRSRASDHGLG